MKQGFGKFGLWSVSRQPAINDGWVLLRRAWAKTELLTWPGGRKNLPLLPPWHSGAGTCHGAAHEEHLSALLHAKQPWFQQAVTHGEERWSEIKYPMSSTATD